MSAVRAEQAEAESLVGLGTSEGEDGSAGVGVEDAGVGGGVAGGVTQRDRDAELEVDVGGRGVDDALELRVCE